MSVRKSPKIQKLVVNAIRKLQDVQGAIPREISNYISQEYDVPSTKIQRQVRLALERAVSYGILHRGKGGYYACNRNTLGCEPQMEEGQLTEKCGRHRGRVKRARSCKSRRRKRAAGCGSRRGGRRSRRARGRRSRKRSGRSRGKSGRRKCSGGGRKSRRRRACGSSGKKSRRHHRRRRSGRRGKKCPTGEGGDGRSGSRDEVDVFESQGGGIRRARSVSATRERDRSGSSHSGSFDDERLDEKCPDVQPIESPECLLD